MKRLLVISYWFVSVLLVSLVLTSLGYRFLEAVFVGTMFLPGALAAKYFFPKVDFRDRRSGIRNTVYIVLGILIAEVLLFLVTHYYIMNLRAGQQMNDIPRLLTNPAFIAIILTALATGSHFFEAWFERKHPAAPAPITFTSERKPVTLPIEEILYVESNDDITTVVTTDGRSFRNITPISRWEAILKPHFIRIHRSYLVNKAAITDIDVDILLLGETQLPISRKYKDEVLAFTSVIKSLLLPLFAALLIACGRIDDNPGGNLPILPDGSYGEEIGTFYVENREMTLRLMDITSLYQEVCYINWAVPVDHVSYPNLPESLREIVKAYALGAPTQVYQMKWRGEAVYHLISFVYDDINGVYKPSGERIVFSTWGEYFQFLQEVSNVKCLLLLEPEVVKSAEGAPNYLEGTWQSDWLHLHHDISGGDGRGIDDQVELYADLPFSITEVCHFKKDGTGYLRTVKTLKNGQQEVAYDPFNYWLTDYQSTASGYKGYDYLCVFAAGDTIEYTARSRDDFRYVFDRSFYHVTYPWYRQQSDPLSNKKGDPKYGVPAKDHQSPIVGRWTGRGLSAALTFGLKSYTWVFRSDGTGYLLNGRQFNQSFAYTVEGSSDNLLVTLYKYDTGFSIEDGFWTEGDLTYSYVPQPVPKGQPMKARVYDGGNCLELEGWTILAADMSRTPIVFRRVNQ